MDKRDFFGVTSKKAGNFNESIAQEISKIFSETGLTIKFCSFEGYDQLKEAIAKAQSQGYFSFLAIGGDGTISLVASSLYRKPHRLGIIPAGTTNTVARLLGIPLSITEAIKLAASSGNIQAVDGLGVIGRVLILNVSVGLSSISLKNIDSRYKSKLGVLAYFLGIIRSFKRINAHDYHIQVNGSLYRVRAVEIHVTNTGIIGLPRFHIYRNSHIDDGKVEVLILRHWSIKGFINALLDMLTNRKRQAISLIASGDDILIQSKVPMPVQGDGDVIGQTPVRIKVLPRVISFIVP